MTLPTDTASPVGVGAHSDTPLPAEVLRETCRRVTMIAVTFAAVWTLNLAATYLMARAYPGAPGLEGWPMPRALFAGLGIALSVALALFSHRLHDTPERLLAVGLVFEVVTAALVALGTQWYPRPSPQRISWVCAVILAYSAAAPSTPGRTLTAALLAATMDPLALWVTALRGVPVDGHPMALVNMFLPNYLCAFGALIPAHVVRGLGRQVSKARELGSYRLGARIGGGGMGEVYRAEHRLLARPAAIKLIRRELMGSGQMRHVALERFKREAKAASLLRSQHTIDLYDFGVSADGTFYFVMELLDGISLEELVRRHGPVCVERAVHLAGQACDSLAEAHARGIIHRDIKPSNLVASRVGLGVDVLKVLDFGLVKFDSYDGDRPPTLTGPQVATGTPAYMAPEVALAEGSQDHRLDIYSLGCVLYWLVTGKLVFDAENPVRIMHQHIAEPAVAPSRRSELPVPPELDALVLACLAKHPEDRPASAAELAERLAAVPLAEPWTPARARRWWELHLPEAGRVSTPQLHGTLVPAISK